MLRIGIIDDAPAMRKRLVDLFTHGVSGYAVETASDLGSGLALLQVFAPDLLVLDLVLPGADSSDLSAEHGREILRYARREMPHVKVVILTSEGDRAREFLMEEGADDFFCKSREEDWREQKLFAQVERLIGHLPARSAAAARLNRQVRSLTGADHVAFIEGERGVGKGALAEMLHKSLGSPDGGPRTVLLSELADAELLPLLVGRRRPSHQRGLLESPGVVVIRGFEDVGRLSPSAQLQLSELIVGADGDGFHFSPVDDVEALTGPGLLVMISRTAPGALAQTGELCPELASALRGAATLEVPPLRECLEDVGELAAFFLRSETQGKGSVTPRLSAEALEALDRYGRTAGWPGNHRELREAIAGALATCGEEIMAADLGLPEIAESVGAREFSFLSVDVVSSKAMKLNQDPEHVRRSFEAYHGFVEQMAAQNRGEVYATSGDGILCRFREAEDAVRTARAIVGGLAALNATGNRLKAPFRVRQGISTGQAPDVGPERGGEVASETIDRAAALQECAQVDGVLVCARTWRGVGSPPWDEIAEEMAAGIRAHVLTLE